MAAAKCRCLGLNIDTQCTFGGTFVVVYLFASLVYVLLVVLKHALDILF